MSKGPVYGVELISSLPLNGGMRQACPNEDDLRRVNRTNGRVAAGYEVVLQHFREALQLLRKFDELDSTVANDVLTGEPSYLLSMPCSEYAGVREFLDLVKNVQ